MQLPTLQDLYYLYATMLHARVFEERCSILYAQKLIGGFCHLYSGQEAVAIGINYNLGPDDNVITGYRCHVHAIISRMRSKPTFSDSGSPFEAIQDYIDNISQAKSTLAELMGRQTGSSKGKGGSMHLYDKDYNFYGGHGIVGIQIPLGAGLAFADKYKNRQAVTFASLGDGAMNQGQVYEAFNMAKIWKLPIIFVLENNGFAIGTASHRASGDCTFRARAAGFGLQTFAIDGMNISDVIETVKEARRYALEEGPVFMEMDTYRYRPHSMSDPATYRSKEDVNKVKETRDPIDFIKRLILEKDPSANFEQYEDAEQKRMDEIVDYASDSLLPGEEELTTDIYATQL